MTITGDGKQTRDFIHVSDIVDGLIEMAKGNWKGDVFNLGTGINYSINEIANMFGGEIKYIERPQREAENIQADTSLTTKNLPAWSPKINIKDYINGLNYA